MSANKYLIVLGGPTASGKTAFAIQLAKHFRTEIISCDSRQFYREMNIGTAKPTIEELTQAKHHFINSLSIEDEYSVGAFEKQALTLLDELFIEKDYVIMSGGSGLFINAVCFGLDQFPEIPEKIRLGIEQDYHKKGIHFLQDALKTEDPEYYKKTDLQNPRRLMRALEVIRASGKPFSFFHKGKNVIRQFTPIFLQLHLPRQLLYERINKRVDMMIKKGLLMEVEGLFSKRKLNALQTVGYQEIISHLEGKSNLEEAVNLIKQNSRRYGKRQITWMRRDGFWKHIRPEEYEFALSIIDQKVKNDLSIRVVSIKDLLLKNSSLYPSDSKVIAVFRKNEIIGYSVIEIHPKKVIFHPVELDGQENEIKHLLQHEAALMKEELGR